MKTLELENLRLSDLNDDESLEINGGNPFWIGLVVGMSVRAAYDFVNGVYTGIQLELENK